MRSLVEVTVGHFKLLGMTEEMFRQMVHDGVDIIRILIENYRNDFKAAVDGYKGLDGRVGSLRPNYSNALHSPHQPVFLSLSHCSSIALSSSSV